MKTRGLLVLLTVIALAACGYKGDLYLPDKKPGAAKKGAVVTPDPAPDRPVPAEAVPPPK
jgi:predicted small lipoprotein YifL